VAALKIQVSHSLTPLSEHLESRLDGARQSGSRQDSGENWRGSRSQRGLRPAGMADPQAPGPAGEGKKKRRVKKKAPAQPGAGAATPAQPAAPAKPEPPVRRPKLTLEDRQHYDFIRECTVKNVWCARARQRPALDRHCTAVPRVGGSACTQLFR